MTKAPAIPWDQYLITRQSGRSEFQESRITNLGAQNLVRPMSILPNKTRPLRRRPRGLTALPMTRLASEFPTRGAPLTLFTRVSATNASSFKSMMADTPNSRWTRPLPTLNPSR